MDTSCSSRQCTDNQRPMVCLFEKCQSPATVLGELNASRSSGHVTGGLHAQQLRLLQDDARLTTFQAFLAEVFEVATLVAFMRARALLSQPAPLSYVLYPTREAGKSEAPPWVCLRKAVWVAGQLLGPRSAAVRQRFEEILRGSAVQVCA